MKIIWWIGISILSGICYRLGGSAKKGNWLDFARNSKTRDIGCSLVFLGLVGALFGFKMAFWWVYVIVFGLSWGALSTYWSELQNPKDDVSGLEWGITGFIYGLVAFPLIWCGVHWYSIIIRSIVLGILTAIWSNNIKNATIEEFGRGFFIIVTMPLLLI